MCYNHYSTDGIPPPPAAYAGPLSSEILFPSPTIDNIWAMVFVWR